MTTCTVNTEEAVELIIDAIKANITPYISGSPGLGKSAIVKQIADDYGLELIDVRLSQCEPSDLSGFPMIDPVTKKAKFAPMEMFPIEGDPLPKGKRGWLLFLDELPSAALATQSAAYKLILDKAVGMHKLHEKVVIVAAGNLETDAAFVNKLNTATQSRLIHLELAVDHKIWLKWASNNDIDYRVKAFIDFKPSLLHSFDPNHTDKTFPCSRTWDFVSRLVKPMTSISIKKIPLIAGTIGEGAAREFYTFTKIFDSLPTLESILLNPTGVKVPDEPSVLFALTGSLGESFTETNADKLIIYIERMPIEFQLITLRNALPRIKGLAKIPCVSAWLRNNANELFD